MIEGAGIISAGALARAGIHAEFQALAMHIIRQRLHALGEFFRIGHQAVGLGIAGALAPAIVDNHIFIARLPQAQAIEGVGAFPNQPIGNAGAEGIPGVPAHGRFVHKHGCILLDY